MSAITQPFSVRLLQLPLFLLMMGFASFSMLLPAAYAVVIDAHLTARSFFYSSLVGLIIFGMIALAHQGRNPRHGPLGPLVSLLSAFLILPVVLAVPFYEAVQTTSFFNAYLEMVSAMTTTGATLFNDPERLDNALHLWRGLVGWMGGLLMWLAASAILAPLNLGGFEVTARAEPGRRETRLKQDAGTDVRERLTKAANALFPIYLGLTGLLWLLLVLLGDSGIVALVHAMSILATSGISPTGGLEGMSSGIAGEAIMLLFMSFALSRLTFSKDTITSNSGGLVEDPEFRIGLILIIIIPAFLFVRHWLGAFDVMATNSFFEAVHALWGSTFTVMSFLTTTGFTSASWGTAQSWSGLQTPGLLFLGLALVGGGVATTAGGVKLLRVFALYTNGHRELERLVHPSSVSGASAMGRRLQKGGAFIAWIFFMLFAISLAVICIVMTAFSVPFEEALIMTIAGLSTTGPLLVHAGDTPIELASYGAGPKSIFALAMIIGRLETLAIIALLTPDLWRS